MMKSRILILGLILCLSGCAVENTIPETTTITEDTTIESSSAITTSVDNTETTTQTLPIETTEEETTLEDNSTNQTTNPTETTFEPYSEGDIRGSLPIVSSEENTNESDITLITGTPKIIFNETDFPIEIEANPYGLYYSYTGDYAYIPELLVPYVKAVPTDYTISGNYMDDSNFGKPDTDFLTELGEKDVIFYFHDNGTLIGEQTVTIKIIDTIKPTVTIQGAVKEINNDLCSLVTEVSDSIFGNYTYAPTFDDLTLFSWAISEDGFRQYASGESAFYYTDILYWDNTGMHYIMNVCYKLDKENGIGIEDFRIAP